MAIIGSLVDMEHRKVYKSNSSFWSLAARSSSVQAGAFVFE
jgi:hypothetical protein